MTDLDNENAVNGSKKTSNKKKDRLLSDIEAVRPKVRIDKQIWGIYIALVLFSIIELYSASSREVVAGNILSPLLRHVALLGLGFLIMIGLQRVHYRKFYRYTWAIVTLSILATFYTMFFGDVINGARRSFSFFGMSVQPSELLKFSAALFIARVLCNYVVYYRPGHEDEDKRYDRRLVAWVAFMVLFFGGLLIKQGLTNTVLLMVISLSMMIIGGVKWKELGVVVGIYFLIGGAVVVYKVCLEDKFKGSDKTEQLANAQTPADENNYVELKAGEEHDRTKMRMKRFTDFLRTDKYLDTINSDNQQEQYSYIAQANGGIIGVFPGNSRETARLPLAFSDYIFAIVIEDTGLVGGMLLLALYLWLLARAGRIAMTCKKAFPALLVIGMAVFIVYQALFHMGIVTGCLPVSGQPLPLMSKGGSSVIVTSIALGMMLSVSRFAQRKGIKEEVHDNINALSDSDMPDNAVHI
jgi:cell division protein FtsW